MKATKFQKMLAVELQLMIRKLEPVTSMNTMHGAKCVSSQVSDLFLNMTNKKKNVRCPMVISKNYGTQVIALKKFSPNLWIIQKRSSWINQFVVKPTIEIARSTMMRSFYKLASRGEKFQTFSMNSLVACVSSRPSIMTILIATVTWSSNKI